jgi:hypothetical protein
MAKKSKSNKKVVVTTKKEKLVPTVSSRSTNTKTTVSTVDPSQLIFDKGNYIFIIASIALVVLGMLLMLGGNMPDPNTWDESLIYGARRTVVAPIVILAGLGVGVYAIFKR